MAKENSESNGSTFKVLFSVILVEIIAFASVIPILPLLLTAPESPLFILPDTMSVGTGYILLGLITASYPFGQFISTPILGQLSDKYGRRPLLMFSIMGTVVANTVFGIGVLTANIPLLLVSKLFDGLTGGNVSVVQASVADISSDEKKAERFSKLGAAFGVGLSLGPAIAGLLSSGSLSKFFTPSTPFFFAAGTSMISLSIVYFKLQETSPMNTGKMNPKMPFLKIKQYLVESSLRSLFLTNLLYFIGFAFFTTFSNVILSNRFGLEQLQIGGYYLLIGLMLVATRFTIVPRVFEDREESSMIVPGLAATSALLFSLFGAGNLALYLFITGGFVISNSITQVAIQSTVSIGSKSQDQGVALGIYSSMRALGQSIPGLIAGVAAAAYSPDVALVMAGATTGLTGVFYFFRGSKVGEANEQI